MCCEHTRTYHMSQPARIPQEPAKGSHLERDVYFLIDKGLSDGTEVWI